MQLTDSQKDQVRQWLAAGLKLSDVQKRLETDFGLRPTYMEVRFLVDDLKVTLKDPEPPKKVEPAPDSVPPGSPLDPQSLPAAGGVKVTVDRVTRPGSLVSGRVSFSDGQGGTWFVDQMGRPGLAADKKGYKPSPADMQDFQVALEQELVKLGI